MILLPTKQLSTERVDKIRKMLASKEGQDLIRVLDGNAQKHWAKVLTEMASYEGRGLLPEERDFEEMIENARLFEQVVGVLKTVLNEEADPEALEYITIDG